MATYKIIDETLYNYVKNETQKRFPDVQFTSSSLGRGRLAIEDRYFSCYPFANQQKPYLYFHQGYIYLITDKEYEVLDSMDLNEKTVDFVKYRSKERILNTNSYHSDNATVLDAFLTLIRRMRGVCPTITESVLQNKDLPSENEEVSLSTMTLDELFHKPLCIPDYQRIYCWEEENVRRLWQDILKLTDKKPYHMGAIILHEKGEHGEMNVVDGQQRLVTLSLILHLLDSDFKSPLFNQKFQSEKAAQYVAYNYFLINQYLHSYLLKYEETKREGRKLSLKKLIQKQLTFSVLTLSGDNLDLAYTFFSNQNSKGLSLTDYNLLKAHHLRFIPNEEQSMEVASHWDALLSTQSSNVEENVARTLGLFLFRLRKWRRKQQWDEDKRYRVKAEFEAAPTMPQIPAFGEQFNYYESIQGGAHFFAYTEKFVHLYKKFREEIVYQLLEEHLSYSSHWRYKDIIQAMLFAYYVKFGDQYIDMAFQYIEPLVSKHRYSTPRALHYRILQAAAETDIVMMIDQATSPTFFLAEAKLCCDNLPTYDDAQLSNIQKNYKLQIKNVLDKINIKNL